MSVYGEVGFPHQDSYENVGSLGSAQTCCDSGWREWLMVESRILEWFCVHSALRPPIIGPALQMLRKYFLLFCSPWLLANA